MCNRFRLSAKEAELARQFGADISPERGRLPPPELFPRYETFVVRKEEERRTLDVMRWGVPLNGKPITNVRNLSSPFWRNMVARADRRCLVPVSEFCEWEGEKGAKVARWFSLADSPVFAFAGIWRPTPGGNAFAFLTCEPNPIVAPIHPKAMPVVLHPEDYDRWLDGDVDEVCSLATPFPSQLMKVA